MIQYHSIRVPSQGSRDCGSPDSTALGGDGSVSAVPAFYRLSNVLCFPLMRVFIVCLLRILTSCVFTLFTVRGCQTRWRLSRRAGLDSSRSSPCPECVSICRKPCFSTVPAIRSHIMAIVEILCAASGCFHCVPRLCYPSAHIFPPIALIRGKALVRAMAR